MKKKKRFLSLNLYHLDFYTLRYTHLHLLSFPAITHLLYQVFLDN